MRTASPLRPTLPLPSQHRIVAGEALKPSVEDAARAKVVVQQLHVTLCGQSYGGCSVDRLRVSGSRGRNTSLMGSDVDVVLVLNKARPPWDHPLADIARRLADELHVVATVARCARPTCVAYATAGLQHSHPSSVVRRKKLTSIRTLPGSALQPVFGAHSGAAGLQL
jgi:hypothetical protein